MRKTLLIMSLAIAGLGVAAFVRNGWPAVMKALLISAQTLFEIVPLLLAAFVLAGLVSEVVSTQTVDKWMGHKSGLRGIVLASLAGAIIPGGPYIFFPLAATFLLSGARIGGVIAFLAAKNLWSLSRLPMEFALLDPKLVFIRYAVTFVFPILLGIAANFLFSGYTAAIRESIPKLKTDLPANSEQESTKC
ncbi:MAG: permease [Thermodesulfobacteriota bacterium]